MDKVFKHVPMFLEASSREELVKAMLNQNLDDRMSYRFFDIQFDPQKKVWVAWFYPENDKIEREGF